MSTQQIDAGLRCLNVLNAVQVNVDGVVEIDGVVEKQSVVPIPYESYYPLDSVWVVQISVFQKGL